MEGRDEEEAFRSLDADRMDRFNVFLLFYYLFNLVIFITIFPFLLLLT